MMADLRLYHRMRGLFWGMLVFGMVLLPTIIVLILLVPSHLELYDEQTIADIGRPGAAIGAGLGMLGIAALIGSLIFGATAGSVDLQRGVIRDLVLAGRPRWRIILGRTIAAAAWVFAALAVSIGLVIATSLLLTPLDDAVSWERVLREGLQFLPGVLYTLPFAAGVAMIIGSRGPAIAVFFVIALLVDNILVALPKVGEWWEEVSLSMADQRMTAWILEEGDTEQSMNHAIAVLVGWAVIPFVLGLIRLTRRDL